MGTTTYFENIIHDDNPKSVETIDVEAGTTSYLGHQQMFLRVGEKKLILDEKTEKEFLDAFHRIGHYLGHY
ncbi:MAG: hypothetical protein ISR45_09490 [Rhodospirillales bacterium]|nr:hypothetical protein [Rhodospirillales bacterium]